MRTITGWAMSGNFRYYVGPSPNRFRPLPEGCGDLFGRVCHNGLFDYWTPVEKQALSRTITGFLTSGHFIYYMGPSPTRFRALPDVRGHLFRRVCRNGLMNYWTPAQKKAHLRTTTGLITSGDFSYYACLSPTRFRALSEGCRHLVGRGCRNGIMNYWTPAKK